MPAEKGSFTWGEGKVVSALWHHPQDGATYFILAHGAGGNLHTPALAQFAEALAARGIGAVRFNFPYSEAQRKVPDPQKTLEACYRAVATQVAARASLLLLGGRSMGGRIASHVVAGGFARAVGAAPSGALPAGLVFLSYPLHPPGQPERLRDAHLGKISVPMLFLQGSRDAFARPDLLTATVARLPTATLHVVEGADHSLVVRGRPAEDMLRELVEATVAWINAVT